MVWQDVILFPGPHVDAEQEREARLAAQARAGADWALGALIARYQPVVVRYLTRVTGDGASAVAIAERIFVRMERRLHGPQGAQHLRLWLLRASTEAGLDALRHPHRAQPPRLHGGPQPLGLIEERASGRASQRLRAGLGRLAGMTGTTQRQVRKLIWSDAAESVQEPQPRMAPVVDDELDRLDPREALRHRLVRAVLAELPYGDAQCLALHLVAGLNQTEVAQALGIRPSAARHRIVQGLQLFARRYEAALASLGISPDVAYERPEPEEEEEELAPPARGEDRVIPQAASAPGPEPDEEIEMPREHHAWPHPPQRASVDMPQTGIQMQHDPTHSVAAMVAEGPDQPADDEPASDDTLAEVVDEPDHEHVAIPVAESAIVGPIVDAMPVAAPDVLTPSAGDVHELDAQTLGYAIVVEPPRVVEANSDAEASTPLEVEPVSWPNVETRGVAEPPADAEAMPSVAGSEQLMDLSGEPDPDSPAGARIVPILSTHAEREGVAEDAIRSIPVLSPAQGEEDLNFPA
jgi:RNA polymerase sigma factor (sigma-70 family)